MMKFIFEDSPDSAISKLLLSLYNTYDTYIIFFDFPCSNRLYIKFLNLRTNIKNSFNYVRNIYIVPIPCIEYIVLAMLYKYYYSKNQELESILKFDKSIIDNIKASGLEHKLKKYLNSLDIIFVNYNTKLSSKKYPYGSFYLDVRNTPNLKAEQLYTSLPIFDTLYYSTMDYIDILNKMNISFKYITYDALNNYINEFYKNMSKQLHKVSLYDLTIFV